MKHSYLCLVTLLASLTIASVSLFAQGGADYTNELQNPNFDEGFENGAPVGWTLELTSGSPQSKISTAAKGDGVIADSHWQLWSGNAYAGKGYQTVEGLPNGTYTVSAAVVGSFSGTASVYANNEETEITTGLYQIYSVQVQIVDGTLELGLKCDVGGGSTIDFDAFTLVCDELSEDDPIVVYKQNLEKVFTTVEEYATELDGEGYTKISEQLMADAEEIYYTALDSEEEQEVLDAIDALKALVSDYKSRMAIMDKLSSLLEKAETLCETTEYPGIGDLVEKLDEVSDLMADKEEYTLEEFEQGYETLSQAIRDYIMSQDASFDSPADFSYLIQYPDFFNDDCGLTREEATSDNRSTWGASDGWENGSIEAYNTDFRPAYKGERTCWNSWSNNFQTMDLHQTISDLPNGYYSMKCYGLTYEGELTDQHGYITSSAGTSESPAMTIDMGDTPDGWEELQTGTVLVLNGEVTIGFASTSNGSTSGWWCATDFQLFYHGEEGESGVKKSYDEKIEECETFAATMHLAGDKATFTQVIADNSGKTEKEEMTTALEVLNQALETAKTSEKTYTDVVEGTYGTIKTNLDDQAYDSYVTRVLTVQIALVDAALTAADATYTGITGFESSLCAISGTYCTQLATTVDYASSLSNQEIKDALLEVVETQVASVEALAELMSAELISEYVTALQEKLAACRIAVLYADDVADYTSIITNPTVDTESGWNYNNVSGNQLTSAGAGYDGTSSNRYHNSWNGTAGALRFTVWQTLNNIPNGTYELKTICRVMEATYGAEGFYTYAIADGDTLGAKFHAVHTELINLTKYVDPDLQAEDGSDSLMYTGGRQYGSVWTKAMDETNMGLDPEPGSENELIVAANNGYGYGWQFEALEIEVKNHQLTIGATTDSLLTRGHIDTDGVACIPFSGTQFSVDNYTLTLLEKGDNTGWNPVVTGIEAASQQATGSSGYSHSGEHSSESGLQVTETYDLTGRKMANSQQPTANSLPKGVYIIGGKKCFIR